ncbi:PREDICTED: uncharacterized protein LOC108361977 [Rhagoletis zephyria]|uniref:uncharacterized protein LOC108361977 n=1 Tax=Rhagoletis zephyria TaxID=28612 RepID=UPI0008114DEA|nr:PREDICTED: uncharacterized protein LOC108361977 [Rhagoletis zephyria]
MPRKSKIDFNKNAKTDRVKVKTSPVNAETNIIRRTLRSSNSNLQVRTRNQSRSEKNSPKPVTSSRTRSGNVMSSTVDEAEPSISRKTLAEDKENAELSDESPQKIPKNEPVPMDSNEIVSTKDTADEPMQVDMQSTNVGSKDCAEPQTDSSATKINLNNNKTNIEKKENEVTEEPTQTESPSKDNRNVQRSASIDKLTTLFSNLYLNSVQRLCLQFPPRCAEDLVYCRKQHFQQRFNEMDKPSEARLMQLRCTLKQQRYLSFINLAMDMCQRYEFPGEDTFTNLIELILSLNPKTGDAAFIRTYRQSIELFSYMVRTFPPCWRATHTAYIGFFQRPLDAEKIYNNKSKRDNRLSKSKKVFDIILDLTEIILNECTNEELSIVTEPQTPTNEKKAKEESVVTETPNSEPFDHHKWEERDSRLNTYTALKPTERLERLFIVLRLILQILESDFVMWLLHHYRKNKNWLFYTDSRPLAVFVLGISEEAHLSALGRQLFLLFAMAVNKGLNVNYLKVLERYIALLMVISNTADIEHTVLGVKYPQLGPNTKQIILDFFRKFKDRNLNSSICNYIKAIDVLRIPYVRYTFIDQFLQMFGFLYSENFSPEKVFHYMRKKRWLKQKKQAELHAEVDDSSDVIDEISCEQHLSLLLEALKAYCEWHASKDFMQIILNKRQVSCLKITTHSLHHTPIASGGLLNLARMENDIVHLEGKLRKTVRVAKPVIDLPLMDICIDQDLRFKYRNDLKYLNALQQKVTEQSIAHPEVDFSAWETFLIDFKVD